MRKQAGGIADHVGGQFAAGVAGAVHGTLGGMRVASILDRVAGLKDAVTRAENDVAGIRRELAKEGRVGEIVTPIASVRRVRG